MDVRKRKKGNTMQPQVLIIKGSPRLGGNSDILADHLAKGAREAGSKVEDFSVHTMNIRPCNACDRCRDTRGKCVIQDDMQILYQKIITADAVVVAAPIYWYTFNAQTKTWIDRCYALVMNPDRDVLENKAFGLLLSHNSDVMVSGVLNAMQTFKDMFNRGRIVGVVHGQANRKGDILKKPAILQEAHTLGRQLGHLKTE
jgi:multimeric flavodoxin WrbA